MGSKIAILGEQITRGRLRVRSIAGVGISLHWTLAPAAALWVYWSVRRYSLPIWPVCEGASVFLIILLHELGHALAAREVGCRIDEIVLWPLGGLAILEGTERPFEQLRVFAAGPLVNVLLIPVTFSLWYWLGYYRGGDISLLLWSVAWANVVILLFNLLPIWPLDGGRIVVAVMSPRLGFTRSRMIAGIVGIAFGATAAVAAVAYVNLAAAFVLSLLLYVNGKLLEWSLQIKAAERHWGVDGSMSCPNCCSAPLNFAGSECQTCGAHFNPLVNAGRCWNCGNVQSALTCRYCGHTSELTAWLAARHA